jgi:hypothetical protein
MSLAKGLHLGKDLFLSERFRRALCNQRIHSKVFGLFCRLELGIPLVEQFGCPLNRIKTATANRAFKQLQRITDDRLGNTIVAVIIAPLIERGQEIPTRRIWYNGIMLPQQWSENVKSRIERILGTRCALNANGNGGLELSRYTI